MEDLLKELIKKIDSLEKEIKHEIKEIKHEIKESREENRSFFAAYKESQEIQRLNIDKLTIEQAKIQGVLKSQHNTLKDHFSEEV